jgi:hypothetical protein
MIDVLGLFEEHAKVPDPGDELERVKSGAKPMLLTDVGLETLEASDLEDDGYLDYLQLITGALAADLMVVHHPSTFPLHGKPYCLVTLLIARKEESWRVPAFLSLNEAYRDQPWSDGAARLQSKLLGYSDPEIELYMARERHDRVMFGKATIYVLLDGPQREALERVGMRSFSPEMLEQPPVFFQVSDLVLRRDALERANGLSIGRVAVDWSFVFGKTGLRAFVNRRVLQLSITTDDAKAFNTALESKVQLWTPEGWR